MRRWANVGSDRQDHNRQAKVGPTLVQRKICHSIFLIACFTAEEWFPLGPGSNFSRVHVVYTCYWIHYKLKWIPESHHQLNSRGCKCIMPRLQRPTIEPYNKPYWTINRQFTTWLGRGVQVAKPFNYHNYLLMKFPWPGQCKRVTLDW